MDIDLTSSPKRVLVGFSGSEESRDALRLARALTQATGAELIVACVYAEGPVLEDSNLYAPIPAEWESAAERRERHRRIAAIFAVAERELNGARFVRAEGHGGPAKELQRLATEQAADVVVVGSTHLGWAGRVYPGSVADRMLSGSPCAVAIAPRGYASREQHGLRDIGVGFNGSSESKLALGAAHDIAAAVDGRLRLIAVVPFEMPNLWMSLHMDLVSKRLSKALAAASAGLDDVEVETKLIEADPAVALEHEGKRLDLLVTGSRSYGPLRSVVLGSVSHALVRAAPCPVLVLPRRARERSGSASDETQSQGVRQRQRPGDERAA